MKSSELVSRTVLFEKIYSVCPDFEEKKGNQYSYKTFITRLRKAICSFLEYWKEIGFVKNFEILSEGPVKYHSICIELYEEQVTYTPSYKKS